ncbi:hypothetical protein ACJ73_06671 [Blastomyces percursus]|uniref:Aminoglycoside phosphotransferase domain-containing protein n=1 Tax=Blastomyces percursus TaxID=1658174 RepID=A0A1J9Q085_9EURO|nr:hypothetical protein ACJ73_06671 [Blastomyces percursus]
MDNNRVQELLPELQEEKRLRDEERRLAEAKVKEERQRREEEQRRREKAEALLGPVTKPTNRTVPSLIKIWDSFNDEQTEVWQTLKSHPSFSTKKLFPSKHQLDYVHQCIAPITSEWDLRYYERDTVENQVQDIVDKITKDKALRDAFGLRGSVTFESQRNPLHPEKNLPSEADQQTLSGQAVRFCIYRQKDSEHIPAIAIEYKAPHKLTQAEMVTGLTKEIRTAQDVVNQESDNVDFCCRRLIAAVITQLFSYMVHKGVLAFTVIALKSPRVTQQWHDAASRFDVCPVEYSEILEQTPPPAHLKNASPLYHGRRPRDLSPLKISLRSGGAQGHGKPSGTHQTSNVAEEPATYTRPYCSEKCLRALRDGGPFDPSCSNYQDHRKGRINVQKFCSQMQTQLATDRGPDADGRPLSKAGSCGALFKLRLSSHGYTLVAKGVEYKNRHKLEHEVLIYNRLRDLQGEYVPSIHSKGVLHGDAELRNVLWNPTCKRPMIVDFERAAIRHTLSDVPGDAMKKRRRVEDTGFGKEIERFETAFERFVA